MSDRHPVPSTSIARSTPDEIVIRGRSLTKDLIGHVDFTTMICLHLGNGRMPSEGEIAVVDSVLVSLMEHGITPSSISARLTYMSAPEAVQGAVAAGLLSVGSQFVGSTENAAKILQEGTEEIAASGSDVDTVAAEIVTRQLGTGDPFPGFGHHIHRPDDPRVPRLLEVAREHEVNGLHADLLLAISKALDESKGRHVTINATGAIAAVLADIGYPWQVMRGFSLIARCAGLVGHILEEQEQPLSRWLWDKAEKEVRYVEHR